MSETKRRNRSTIKGKATEGLPTAEEIVESLKPFGLAPGDRVRFRLVDGGDWTYGKVLQVEKDGSLRLYTRIIRSIRPEHCERVKKGPRGGTIWESIT